MGLFLQRLTLCFSMGLSLPAAAQKPFSLSPTKVAEQGIQKYEAYLNQIRTLKATFLEHSSTGEVSSGTLYLSRLGSPSSAMGKLRIIYAPPRPIDILVDGEYVVHYDRDQKEASYIALESTPLGFLLQPQISFAKDVFVQRVEHTPYGTSRLFLSQKGNDTTGHVILVFTENPLALKQWVITQKNGLTTTITLQNVQSGLILPESAFQFKDQVRKAKK